MIDWLTLSLAFVAFWTAIAVLYGLWSAGDARHDPAPPEIPADHGHD